MKALHRECIALAVCMVVCTVSPAAESVPPPVAECNAPPPPWRIDPGSYLPASADDPVTTTAPTRVGEGHAIESRVARIQVEVRGLLDARGMLAADGMSLVPVKVHLFNACGQPVSGSVVLKINADNLRIAPRRDSETDKLVATIGQRLGSDEVIARDGVAEFALIAPPVAQDVALTVRAGQRQARGRISFAPDLRPMIAVGVVDGLFAFGSSTGSVVPGAGMNDGFEYELTRYQREFDNGNASLAGRAAFFAKGLVRSDMLLTASFDSEKQDPQHTLTNINPDKVYSVMGDSSTQGNDARSSDRLYVRLDHGRDYVLYGDFATGEGFSQQQGGSSVGSIKQRNLGQYNRSMTGVRAHKEDDTGFVDGFAMNNSLRQAVEEYPGNGTSGPYSIANLNALENSEKIEIIVRDRNNLSHILSQTMLTSYVDYTFEPFSGRILLKAALPSLDPNLNPVSLRITYEVDTQSGSFWVYGVSGQKKISKNLEVGGSYVKDEDPSKPDGASYATVPGQGIMDLRELISANAGLALGAAGKAVLEVAQSTSATAGDDVTGNAYRLEYAEQGKWDSPLGQGLKHDTHLFIGASDTGFNNPAASYTGGRSDAGLRSAVEISDKTRAQVDAVSSADALAQTSRDAESIRMEHKLDDKTTLDVGVRHVYQSQNAAASFSTAPSTMTLPGQTAVFSGSGLNPNGAGFWGMGSAVNSITGQPQSQLTGQVIPGALTTPALDAWTVRSGLTRQVSEQLALGVEVGQDTGIDNDPLWAAVNTQYREKNWHAFVRAETPTGRETGGADYKITDTVSIYGRFENTNGLASSYALDSAAPSQAFVLGVRQTDGQGLENFNELRMADAINGQDLENATGLRNTFPLGSNLKANLSAEQLTILSGDNRNATALGAGLEWSANAWRGSTRLEWRQLSATPGSAVDDTTQSWMHTLSLARKIGTEWTALIKNYLLLTDNQSLGGVQLQNRFQLGGAYRPVQRNDFDALFTYENKYQLNQEIDPQEYSATQVVATNLNFHPVRTWWYSSRFAAKTVDESITGVQDSYQAWLVSGRATHDLTKEWDVGVAASVMGSPDGATQQYAFGVECGYLLIKNVWASVGYNFTGFSDQDLTGSNYTSMGLYMRLRIKLDEHNLGLSPNVSPRFEESQ